MDLFIVHSRGKYSVTTRIQKAAARLLYNSDLNGVLVICCNGLAGAGISDVIDPRVTPYRSGYLLACMPN